MTIEAIKLTSVIQLMSDRTEQLQTGEFIAFRTLSASEAPNISRTKQYATRSKRGCTTCRRRHLRCDETRPVCQRCIRAQLSCIYSHVSTTRQAEAAQIRPQASLSVFKNSEELTDLQFWLEVGGSNAARWHCPTFYEQLLPQFSQAHESARYSLLALSTCVRQWHFSDDKARADVLRRGDHYYSLACEQLLKITENKASIEAALISSLALFFYDSFSDNMARRYVHSNAAISFLHFLKRGLTFNEVSGWRSDTGRAGAQIVIKAADEYLDEISYSVSKEFTPQLSIKGQSMPLSRTRLYHPIWLQLNRQSAALSSDQIPLKPEMVEPPSSSWIVIQAAPDSIQKCHVYLTLWHSWLFTWLINTSISTHELRSSQLLCREWHIWIFGVMRPGSTEMLSMQNRASVLDELFELKLDDVAEDVTGARAHQHLERILTLISSNIKMSRQVSTSQGMTPLSRSHKYEARQYTRGLGKVLEYVLRRAADYKLRMQAYAVFTFQSVDRQTDE